ncbi:hypothetical protein [Demequina aurantiaca]|uniref:hypothetical protein n=1 Tax=Demequina aurantiaca TaxID=676200 RepID=UPI0007855916|nr:hypothetical protein [Demequina aurantiaca]
MLRRFGLLGPGLAMLWAGLAIAGNVIVAGVKFTTDVPRVDLLKVGEVQFQAVGIAEAVVCALFLLAAWPRRTSKVIWLLLAPVVLLLIQEFVVYPPLHERTLATIAGEDPDDSPLHIIYGALEGIKIILLLAIGVLGTLVHAPRSTAVDPAADAEPAVNA